MTLKDFRKSKRLNQKQKKDYPTLWKIQFYMGSLLLSIGLLIIIITITMSFIYWFNFYGLPFVSS